MKNKIIGLVLSFTICISLLTGCAQAVNLSTEQNDIIANYAARTVVKATQIDFTYTPDIKDKSSTSSTENETTEAATDENGEKVPEVDKYAGLAEYLKLVRVKITYNKCTITSTYELDYNGFSLGMSSDEGYKLVVIEYNLHNNTASDIYYTTPAEPPILRLKLANGGVAIPHANLFSFDLYNMKEFKIPANGDAKAIIMFQVSDANIDALEGIEVVYVYDGEYMPLPIESK